MQIAYVVRPYSPWRTRVWAAVAVLVLLVAGYALHAFGGLQAGAELNAARHSAQVHEALNKRLQERVAGLLEANARLQRQHDLDASALASSKQALGEQRTLVMELREEAAFYRAIALPEDQVRNLVLVELRLRAVHPGAQRFGYTVLLARTRRDRQMTSGELKLVVAGSSSGRPVELDERALGGAAPRAGAFQFRNFHRLDGVLTLPADFEPSTVTVQFSALGEQGEKSRVVRVFPWHVNQV